MTQALYAHMNNKTIKKLKLKLKKKHVLSELIAALFLQCKACTLFQDDLLPCLHSSKWKKEKIRKGRGNVCTSFSLASSWTHLHT
jgi:hypothetical protein